MSLPTTLPMLRSAPRWRQYAFITMASPFAPRYAIARPSRKSRPITSPAPTSSERSIAYHDRWNPAGFLSRILEARAAFVRGRAVVDAIDGTSSGQCLQRSGGCGLGVELRKLDE